METDYVGIEGLHLFCPFMKNTFAWAALYRQKLNDHIFGGHEVSVMKFHPFAQPELIHLRIRADRPRFGQAGSIEAFGHGFHQCVMKEIQASGKQIPE